MDIKQEDLVRFWAWCGFGKDSIGNITAPKSTKYNPIYCGIDYPEINLDNLYRYAIPKLQDKGYSVTLTAFECSGFSANIFDSMALSRESFLKEPTESHADSPTEALFNTIMKVIENESIAK
jgi:hypothetical protein